MKRKERKGKGKLFARNTKELIAELKKQLGVDAVVFSAEHRGSVQITLGDEEVGKTILFSGEDILTDNMVALYGACLTVMLGAGCPPLLSILMLAFIANTPACLTQYTCGFAPIYFNAGYFTNSEWWQIGFVMSWLHLSIVLVFGTIWWKVIGLW